MATSPKSVAVLRYRVLIGSVVTGAGDERTEAVAGAPDGGDIVELSEKDAASLVKANTIELVDAPPAPAVAAEPAKEPAKDPAK